MPTKLLIIGGVAGGATAAARARRLDERAQIIIFERGEHISFANCGLPYYIGGVIKEREDLLVTTPEAFKARYHIDIRTFSEVLRIDRDKKEVEVKNSVTGEIYREGYDKIILSPGAEPVKLPIEGIEL
jgi:NADPH-dependent 2,4-dienoyl-CoA reductase/sulfur reductase-like enzyme